MFGAIKNYVIAIGAVVIAVVVALLYKSKAKFERVVRKSEQQARETEKRSTAAMVNGLNKEAEGRDEISKRIAEFARGRRP